MMVWHSDTIALLEVVDEGNGWVLWLDEWPLDKEPVSSIGSTTEFCFLAVKQPLPQGPDI